PHEILESPATARPVTLIIAGVLVVASSGSAAASMRDREQDRQPAAIAEMMDAVNAGDAHRYALRYAPDAVIVIHGSVVLNGRDAIEGYEVELLREFPGAR